MSDIQRIGGSARFSAITIHNNTAYLAGQVSQLKEGDIVAQSKDVFAKVGALLEEAKSDVSRVLSVQIWLKSMDDYAGMNEVGTTGSTRIVHQFAFASKLPWLNSIISLKYW